MESLKEIPASRSPFPGFSGIVLPAVLLVLRILPCPAAISVTHFGDHMVLQRNMRIPIWGSAASGEKVTVQYHGQSKVATAGPDGKWMVKLDPISSGEPSDLILQGSNTLTLKDVVVGEVWLASGQSNMAMSLAHADSSGESIRSADLPLLRFNNARDTKGWSVCSPTNAGGISAVAFYYARELQGKLGVPIGLIVRAVGGTRIEQWMDPGAAGKDTALGKDTLFSGLYADQIAPTMPMAIRGVIWYQGESNETTPDTYRLRLPALIKGWRENWGQGDFAFYLVQLPLKDALQALPEGTGPWPQIREAQRQVLALPHTGLAVALDVGAIGTVHPLNKYPVGYRLSLIARALDYGETGLEYSGPAFQGFAIRGSQVDLRFSHAGTGLVAKGGEPLQGFTVAGADGKWYWADARIHHDTVTVASPSVPSPLKVHYAWSQNPVFNLYNAEGLPASPFRTEETQLPQVGLVGPHARPLSARSERRAAPSAAIDALGRRYRFSHPAPGGLPGAGDHERGPVRSNP